VCAPHRDYKRSEPYPEEWLLIEWPKKESEPPKYWWSTLPEKTSLKSLVKTPPRATPSLSFLWVTRRMILGIDHTRSGT
jgi:hypothetical protein